MKKIGFSLLLVIGALMANAQKKPVPDYVRAPLVKKGYEFVGDAGSGLFAVRKKGLWGIVGADGKPVVAVKQEEIGAYSSGFVWFRKKGKYGVMDQKGKVIIKPIYDAITDLKDGMILAKKGEFWGALNREGKETVAFQYNEITNFSDGAARVKKDDKYGFVDKQGREVILPELSNANPSKNGIIRTEVNGKVAYLNLKGKPVREAVRKASTEFSEGYAFAVIDSLDKNAIINKTGAVTLISNDSMTVEGAVGLGVLPVKMKNRYGFIKLDRTPVVSLDYQNARAFKGGVGAVQGASGKWALVNKGFKVGEFLYDDFGDWMPENTKYILVRKDKKWGIVDDKEKEILKADYDAIKIYENFIAAKRSGGWELLDAWGHLLSPNSFENIEPYSEYIVKVTEAGDCFYYDLSGTMLKKCP